jgi:SSS family transporter
MIVQTAVLAYLAITILIGFLASRRVKTANDFAVAGGKLPFFMSTAAFFATWFGVESILGSPQEFLKNGVVGIIEEPIGAAICLFLVGLFVARRIRKSGHLTFSDMFRERFGHRVEFISAIIMIPSFFTWVSAQFLAMGYLLHELFGIDLILAILMSTALVTMYTIMGGMWAVSWTDSLQMVVIVIGLFSVLFTLFTFSDIEQSFAETESSFFSLYDSKKLSALEWVAAWINVGLGSIVSQDVFQRIMASRNERIAVYSSIAAGILYLTIGLIPIIIAFVGKHMFPEMAFTSGDSFILELIEQKSGVMIQILFFGALLSAILSTASGALLAPATVFAENIVKPYFSQFKLLSGLRWSIVLMSLFALLFALLNQRISDLVSLSSSFGLVSLFLPFCFMMWGSWMNENGAMLGMVLGLVGWLMFLLFVPSIPAIFGGLGCSLAGILIGSYFFKPAPSC